MSLEIRYKENKKRDLYLTLKTDKDYYKVNAYRYLGINIIEDLLQYFLWFLGDYDITKNENKSKEECFVFRKDWEIGDKIYLKYTTENRIIITGEKDSSIFRKHNGNVVFRHRCNLIEFINELLLAYEELLIGEGLRGYFNKHYHEFPITNYIKLKYFYNEYMKSGKMNFECLDGNIEFVEEMGILNEMLNVKC